jgi:hypothetical protein
LGFDTVPCAIYDTDDFYGLSIKSNLDEDTYAPLDLFDWLGIIQRLREEGKTQQETADILGWGRGKVGKYMMLMEKIVPRVLEIAKKHQIGRGTDDVPIGTFNFTEGWFRNSGIYDLDEDHQDNIYSGSKDINVEYDNSLA